MIAAPALASSAVAVAYLDAALGRVTRQVFTVPPRLTVSEWCDRHRYTSPESNAAAGPWRTDRAPYQREILDCIADPAVEELVVMSSSQVGKSEILNNAIAYYAANDPCPMLLVEPTIKAAEDYSRERIAPMIRDSPALRHLFADPKARDGGNTLTQKQYVGGILTINGANSPSGLASKPIRVVLFDEVDRAPASAGTEGDPIKLASRRTETFWNRQVITVSTPTAKGASRIESLYERSSQAVYLVPCPDCGHAQRLVFRREDNSYAVVFERNDDGEIIEASVGYVCEACGVVIPERKKGQMLARGTWVHRYPGRRIRGYHISALYSPWATWAHCCREFLAAKDSEDTLRQFVNTMLGEPFESKGERVSSDTLALRAEPWETLPLEVGTLTAGVDVQADRIEALVAGWGERESAFWLEWHQCYGDPGQDDVWNELESILKAPRDGLKISDVACDTGYQTDRAWKWIDRVRGLNVIGVKGMPGRGRVILQKPAANVKRGRSPWLVGVDSAKDVIAARLKITPPAPDQPVPLGFMRFSDTLDPAFYEQITAEELKVVYVAGRPQRAWRLIPGRRNEGLDLMVYALAALAKRGPRAVAAIAPRVARATDAPSADTSPTAIRPPIPARRYNPDKWSW